MYGHTANTLQNVGCVPIFFLLLSTLKSIFLHSRLSSDLLAQFEEARYYLNDSLTLRMLFTMNQLLKLMSRFR
jgi:hypothetical protein